MNTPENMTDAEHFEEWEHQFDPFLHRLARGFLTFLDAQGERIAREGLGSDDYNRLQIKEPTDNGDITAS